MKVWTSTKCYYVLLVMCFVMICALNLYAAESANDGSDDLTRVLCNIVNIAKGNTGQLVSILILISLAIGLLLGKVTWGVAIAFTVGLGILFGSTKLIAFIAGGDGSKDICEQVDNS